MLAVAVADYTVSMVNSVFKCSIDLLWFPVDCLAKTGFFSSLSGLNPASFVWVEVRW